MDFHAHTRHTEIIGVLGGNFRFDDHGFPTLFVECAYPCKVIRSSGIEVLLYAHHPSQLYTHCNSARWIPCQYLVHAMSWLLKIFLWWDGITRILPLSPFPVFVICFISCSSKYVSATSTSTIGNYIDVISC